ncbi:tRNA 2-thiocytidine biosynthesis protein TtcA [Abeliophyllum distichum]|uniref:tRNA 2-thiocytidine biosynthesis protein TtcA n=1 Tax=Abeliophyllum distichum TaxID=126358 RepID=A0ABD1RYE8_9LAMI
MQQDYVLIGVPLLPQSTLRKRQVQLLYFRVDPAFASPSGSQSNRAPYAPLSPAPSSGYGKLVGRLCHPLLSLTPYVAVSLPGSKLLSDEKMRTARDLQRLGRISVLSNFSSA